ncbi:hypothetical protein AB0A94_38045 [Streptomyces sp. NPDC044984]|uniref:hypothetical protein n=1 Tax=Streptomyces sp. NPDC044984 TaxID=3154335 RepID=UPI0033EFDF3D
MDQDDDGLAAETAPDPRPGVPDLIGPVARAPPGTKASESGDLEVPAWGVSMEAELEFEVLPQPYVHRTGKMISSALFVSPDLAEAPKITRGAASLTPHRAFCPPRTVFDTVMDYRRKVGTLPTDCPTHSWSRR